MTNLIIGLIFIIVIFIVALIVTLVFYNELKKECIKNGYAIYDDDLSFELIEKGKKN